MPKINDGGPAFPVAFQHVNKTDGTIHSQEWAGLSLRDYFAAAALGNPWLMSRAFTTGGGVEDSPHDVMEGPDALAEWCYGLADAMIAERQKAAQEDRPEHTEEELKGGTE